MYLIMEPLNERYITETLNEDGEIGKIEIACPENYNFG